MPSSPEIFCVGTIRRASESGACDGAAVLPAFKFGAEEFDGALGAGAAWYTGALGAGLLGALLCMLDIEEELDEEVLDEELDGTLGGGLDGAVDGALGVLLEECCPKPG